MTQRGLCIATVLGLLMLAGQQAAHAQQLKATDLPEGTKIVVDGKLDEPAWQEAASSEPFHWLEIKKKPAGPVKTQFKVLKSADSIYFGITCAEPLMSKLRDSKIGPVIANDCVEVFLAPDGKPSSYYQFLISAANVVDSHYFIEGGHTTAGEYNAVVESAVAKGPDFWTVELCIPLSALFHTKSAAFSDTWKANVSRERQTVEPYQDYSTWSPLRASFHEPAKFQSIGNMPRKHPRLDLTPTGIQTNILAAKDGKWTGTITVATLATAQSAGNYLATVRADGKEMVTGRPVKVLPDAGSVVLENVEFSALGKALYEIVLSSPKGEVIAAAGYTVRAEYSPMSIELSKPFYGNAIFPGQEIAEVCGRATFNLPAEMLSGAQVKVSLADSAVTVNPQGKSADFAVPAGQLPTGEHPLTVELLQGGKQVAVKTLTIRKLAKRDGSCVYIDEHRRLVVDGKPVFVRGWYGNASYMVSHALRKKYGEDPNSQFVNAWACQQNMEANRLDAAESARVTLDVEPSAKVYESMRKIIEENRSNPKLWWYYLSDEPECRNVSPVYLKHQYDFIKKHDPYRPVMIISRAPALYTECADILNPHPYGSPVVVNGVRSMRSPKDIRNQIRAVITAGQSRLAAWLTPQAFSYGFQDSQAVYPTFDEYRCHMWAAVANGATGFTPFIYSAHFDSMDLRIGCEFVYESMAALEPFLLSPRSLPATVVAAEDGVDVLCKQVDGKVLVIAVNLLDKPVSADIDVPGLAGVTELHGFREATTAQVKEGKFRLSFEPYQVHLLSNPQMGDGLKFVDAVKKQITDANAALKKPGNILFGRGREIEWTTSDTYIITKSLYTMTDGICDAYGWANYSRRQLPAWVEMQFPTFTPRFSSARIYSATIEDMDFLIWKAGDWKPVAQIRGNKDDVIDVKLPEQTTTVKIKLLISRIRSGPLAEVYEIELYE